MTEWMGLPAALRQFDAIPEARCREDVITQIVWSCLADLPSLAALLGLQKDVSGGWNAGKRGCGDITGHAKDGTTSAHIEIKSGQARISYGSSCPHGCVVYCSQFEHMAHDKNAVIQVFTHTSRMHELTGDLQALGLGCRVGVRSFIEMADAIEQALKQHGAPQHDLLSSLLDLL